MGSFPRSVDYEMSEVIALLLCRWIDEVRREDVSDARGDLLFSGSKNPSETGFTLAIDT